ncbi:MAG: DNA-binding domain-containing protein [Pseudomonadota bacterium]|nr:DNA-binding domain-containing protein [Pseudomonadota bacterium]
MTAWPTALLTSDDVPGGVSGPDRTALGNRFEVYRNNVMSSLVQAMRDGFPVVRRLVGERFFAAMATEFVRAHPPTTPMLFSYGGDFPAFLATFAPAATLPYLADIARLELALRRAYHAADALAVEAAALARPGIERARITLAPAVAVLTSPYPIHAIWWANMDPAAPKPASGAQSVLITRADWEPLPEPIPHAEAAFVTALATAPLGVAAEAAPVLDLAPALARLIARKAVTLVDIR